MGITSIKRLSENSLLGLWHITESVDELFGKVILSSNENEIYYSKKTDSRKKEWLACRNLIKEMLHANVEISYDQSGKPFLTNHEFYISMSHSGEYSCVYVNGLKPVGVDIQKFKSSIKAGYDFFIHESDEKWVNTNSNELLHIIWSIKETVFKYFGIPELDIKKDIVVNPFTSNENGIIEVNILNHGPIRTILVYYQVFDGYVLTYTI